MELINQTENRIDYYQNLHSNQLKVWNHPARFKVLVAGRRFGKTILALNYLVDNALQKAGSLNWYIAPTYRQAKMIAWKMLFDYIPSIIIVNKNESELSVKLVNGSEICLKGADVPDSLRGVGVDRLVADEYSQMRSEIWEEILRPMFVDTGGDAMFIGTPKGKNHFYKMYLREKEDSDYKSFHFTSYDNTAVANIKAEIDKARKESGETYFKQEYMASFEDYEGLVWPEFNPKYHVIPQIEIPKEWKTEWVIDMGTSGTIAGHNWATDFEGNVIIYKEYYAEKKFISEHSTAILRLAGVPQLYAWACKYAFYDTQASKEFEKYGRLGKLADLYRDNEIYLMPTLDTSDAGRERVAGMFKIDKEKPHPFRPGLQGAPKIFITSNCVKMIEQVDKYRKIVVESNRGIKTVVVKKDDHCAENLTRLIMRIPTPLIPERKIERDEYGLPVYVDDRMEEAVMASKREEDEVYGYIG